LNKEGTACAIVDCVIFARYGFELVQRAR